MENYRMIAYLDSLRAGHSYVQFIRPGEEEGETYGFYPAAKEEKKEVLFGKGSVRKDDDRLKNSGKDPDVKLLDTTIDLTEKEYERAINFVQEQHNKPNWYFLLGYNCVDFIQGIYEAAKGKDATSFLCYFDPSELENLSWVGVYARLTKEID